MPPRPRLIRLALAVIAGCTAATAAYALLRVGQFLVFTEPNPALVIYSEHAAYFWRAWIAVFFGVSVAFAASLATDLDRLARTLTSAVVVAALLLTAQAAFVP